MSATTITCIHCHRPLAGSHDADSIRHYICDLCMESIRTQKPIVPLTTNPPPHPDERKSKRRKGRNTKPVATALVFMLLSFVGCTVHREADLSFGPLRYQTTLDVQCDPRELTLPGSPETAVEIQTPENRPTES